MLLSLKRKLISISIKDAYFSILQLLVQITISRKIALYLIVKLSHLSHINTIPLPNLLFAFWTSIWQNLSNKVLILYCINDIIVIKICDRLTVKLMYFIPYVFAPRTSQNFIAIFWKISLHTESIFLLLLSRGFELIWCFLDRLYACLKPMLAGCNEKIDFCALELSWFSQCQRNWLIFIWQVFRAQVNIKPIADDAFDLCRFYNLSL